MAASYLAAKARVHAVKGTDRGLGETPALILCELHTSVGLSLRAYLNLHGEFFAVRNGEMETI